MTFYNSVSPEPRFGNTLEVLVGCRISGCVDQKEVSLVDQEDHAREVVEERYTGPAAYKVIATIGKGEALDRPELADFERELRSDKYDLFLLEDIGRLIRGAQAVWLLGIGKDHGVRTLSPNDGLDTDDPRWEEIAMAASQAHLAHNAHASMRIKQKSMNRFQKEGGCPARPPAGYIIPPGVVTYGGWQKDPAWTLIFKEICRMLTAGRSYVAVASWMNAKESPSARIVATRAGTRRWSKPPRKQVAERHR